MQTPSTRNTSFPPRARYRQYVTGTSPTARLGGDGYVGATSSRSVYGTPPSLGRSKNQDPYGGRFDRPMGLPDTNAERLALMRAGSGSALTPSRLPEDNRTPGARPGAKRAGPVNATRVEPHPGQGPGSFVRGRSGFPSMGAMGGIGGPTRSVSIGPGASQRSGSAKRKS